MSKETNETLDSGQPRAIVSHSGGNSALIPIDKGGRPSKYTPETVDRLLAALADGLTQKQACAACGICEKTLANWREQYPELEPQMAEARETARQKALAGIKAAGEAGDWRALEAFLRLSFPEYRQPSTKVEVNATAQAGVVVNDEEREKLIAMRNKALAQKDEKESLALPAPQAQEPEPRENLPVKAHVISEPKSKAQSTEPVRPFRDWEEIGSENGLG